MSNHQPLKRTKPTARLFLKRALCFAKVRRMEKAVKECDEALERVEASLKKPLKRDESFVVVAPEPIATLVSSVLRGEPAHLAGPIPNGCGQRRVERISPLPIANIATDPPSSTSLLWRGLPSGELPAIM